MNKVEIDQSILTNIAGFGNFELKCRTWIAPHSRAIVLIVHGMTEHSGRYHHFANIFTQHGFSVYAYDQRNHGLSVPAGQSLGAWPKNDSWKNVKQDLSCVYKFIESNHPGLPLFIFAHSMGSMVTMAALQDQLIKPKWTMLSGYPAQRKVLIPIAKIFAYLFASKRNELKAFPFQKIGIHFLANRFFKPRFTPYDWLSSDPIQVRSYINDPLCQMTCSWGFYTNLLEGIESVHQAQKIKSLDPNLNLLFLFGDQDPIAGFETGIMRSLDEIRQNHRHPEFRIYSEGRHELFADYTSADFFEDLISYIEGALAETESQNKKQ